MITTAGRKRIPVPGCMGRCVLLRECLPLVGVRGRGAAGSAPHWQCGGQGFESPRLHPVEQAKRLDPIHGGRGVFCLGAPGGHQPADSGSGTRALASGSADRTASPLAMLTLARMDLGDGFGTRRRRRSMTGSPREGGRVRAASRSPPARTRRGRRRVATIAPGTRSGPHERAGRSLRPIGSLGPRRQTDTVVAAD